MLMLGSFGAILTWYQDIRNDRQWFGHSLMQASLIVTLEEPPVNKTRAIKANASADYLIIGGKIRKVKGKLILYFNNDSLAPAMRYGSVIILNKPLQEIRNAGNPGGFDYKTFSLFQSITHQVFLKKGEFAILSSAKKYDLNGFLYDVRDRIVSILRTNIENREASGLAEALLIGYKDDLDKSLVQSYSNTGVVHIIAISGMHLALIYWLINLLLAPIGKRKRLKWLKPLIAISFLWLFSLLTGASASVLRAAVMFTFLIIAESLSKKSAIYNTLAASAFCLLCYDPFWLWDVGFQLSYAAVISIVVFMKPIYNLFYIRNKLLNGIWKLNAVTFAAQVLTTPVSIYHFHQFPMYFFMANFVAVPLSSIIVLGEILVCAVSFLPIIASFFGVILWRLIELMNGYVERVQSLPGSLWDGLSITILQTVLLYAVIVGVSVWLMQRERRSLYIALLAILGFVGIRSYSFCYVQRQKAIIIYNVAQQRAIDFIDGRSCYFWGDSSSLSNAFVYNFNIKPARVIYRLSPAPPGESLLIDGKLADFDRKHITVVDRIVPIVGKIPGTTIDLLILSKSSHVSITQLSASFVLQQVVFDSSVPFWKLPRWKKECDSLHIPYHDVNEQGAYVKIFDWLSLNVQFAY